MAGPAIASEIKRADVPLAEAAGLLEGGRELAPAPPEREPELREQRREPGNVDSECWPGPNKNNPQKYLTI